MKHKSTEYLFKDIAKFRYGKMPKRDKVLDIGKYPVYSGYRYVGYYDEYNTEAGQLIVVARGVGGTGDVKLTKEKCFLTNLSIAVEITANDVVIPEYLYYMFSLNNLRYLDSGSAQSQITISDLERLKITLPDVSVQCEIVSILKALDDKIALNQQINKNLEEQAQAIYKAWFIDYAPYGGKAPKEWQVVTLNDVCQKITDGSHYSPTDSPHSPYPMYSVKDMGPYGFDSSSCKHITEEELQKMKQNDCVPQIDDILVAKDGSYLKEIFICSCTKDEAILSSIAIFRPDYNILEPEILLYFLKQPSIKKDVGENYVSGSALPRIVLKDFKKYPFVLPPIEVQHKISPLLHSYRMQVQSNFDETCRFAAIRDALLPRLMSGEIDVSGIEF